MKLLPTPIYVSQGFALLTAACLARQLASEYIAEGRRDEASRHKDRARFWLDMSSRRSGPRLPR
jgi:hypothetical protein